MHQRFSVLLCFLHTDEIWEKRLADLGQSHQKKLTHLTVLPSPPYSSLASLASPQDTDQASLFLHFVNDCYVTVRNVQSWQQLNLLPAIPRETLRPGQAAGAVPVRKTRSRTSALDILPLAAAVPPPPPIRIDFIINFATLVPDGLQPHAVGESLIGLGLCLSPPSQPVRAPGCSPPWSCSKSNPPKFDNSLRSSPNGCPEACDCLARPGLIRKTL